MAAPRKPLNFIQPPLTRNTGMASSGTLAHSAASGEPALSQAEGYLSRAAMKKDPEGFRLPDGWRLKPELPYFARGCVWSYTCKTCFIESCV